MAASPSWHRKQRARRATARARIHKSRRAGKPPRVADLFLLASHHTRPVYSELPRMGKQGSQAQKGQGWQQNGYGSAGWHGAPWRQPWGQGAEASQSVATMRYDQVVLSGNATLSKPNADAHGDAVPMNVTQLVQKAVNVSRKASNKVKRLEQEIALKQQQWEEFQKMLKQAFRSQLTQYETDVSRLEKDLGEAKQSAAEAEQKLKEVTMQHGNGETRL